MEEYHRQASKWLEEGKSAEEAAALEALLHRSVQLSHRLYEPLREAMNDLVRSIVLLLLLAVPFSFAMERLLFCATSVYRRLTGFAAVFLTTFGLLYLMHPGFSVATTPLFIFLAFTIIVLSSLVIIILVRKFETELKVLQGQSDQAHSLEVSRVGTLLAAVGMGMSTMRRRSVRTILTAVTVVMLAFTILAFASFGSRLGVRATYEGPPAPAEAPGLLVRQLDYRELKPRLLELLQAGGGAAAHGQWWLARRSPEDPPVAVARAGHEGSWQLDGILGLDPDEPARWENLRAALGGDAAVEAFRQGSVFLPGVYSERLGLEAGDAFVLAGRQVRFGGDLDAGSLQRLRHLDGRSLIPVDFREILEETGVDGGAEAKSEDLQVQREYTRLSPFQIVIAPADLVRELGGTIHMISMYPEPGADPRELGESLAPVLRMPVWTSGAMGVEQLIFTRLAEMSGGLSLAIPVLLGGLIIFGTLLGSISDREKEVYTFSALGLAPKHVGFLFLAEAAVYAVVGGMGGQLLAQAVVLGVAPLAERGLLEPLEINCSSSNALFAIGIVMATVLVSAAYPAYRASKSANPGLQRAWRLPAPEADVLALKFPFTVSAYDITGVVSFLAEYFRLHNDAGLGRFAAKDVAIGGSADRSQLVLRSELALAPFDLGVTQIFALRSTPSEIEGVDEVTIETRRLSGSRNDWKRANHVFIHQLRRQFLLWRTLPDERVEDYRRQTLEELAR